MSLVAIQWYPYPPNGERIEIACQVCPKTVVAVSDQDAMEWTRTHRIWHLERELAQLREHANSGAEPLG